MQTNVTQTNEIQTNEKAEKFNRACGRWMFRIAGMILCINVLCRIVDAGKSMDYVQVTGTVTMTQTTKEWVRAGNRSREMPRYHVWIEYPIQGYEYPETIFDTYHDNMFSKGDTVPVLYRKDAVYEAYAAKKDWMTGAYLPVSKWYNVPLIIAGVLFVFGFLLYKNEVDLYAYVKYFITD